MESTNTHKRKFIRAAGSSVMFRSSRAKARINPEVGILADWDAAK
jgi:hypothetical protein